MSNETQKNKIIVEVSIPFLNVKITGDSLIDVLNILTERVKNIEETAQKISLKHETLETVASTPLLKIARDVGVEVPEITTLIEERDGSISLKLGFSSTPNLKYMDAIRILLFALTSGYSKIEILKEDLKPLLQFGGFDISVLPQYINALENSNEIIKQKDSVRLTRPGIEAGKATIKNYLEKLKGEVASK